MNNILLVGNGFDLAHGLLTKYEDFLYLIKNWEEFYEAYHLKRNEHCNREKQLTLFENYGQESFEELWETMESFRIYKYLNNVACMDENTIIKMSELIKDNSWVKYYCNCGAEIDGWIDFEREIYPVMELFENIFSFECEMMGHENDIGNAYIKKELFNDKQLRIAKLWDKYIDVTNNNAICIRSQYASAVYGILKKTIIQSLRSEFDDFIHIFEMYLIEFVNKKHDIKLLRQIEEIGADCVISFNYTSTEQLYGINGENVHHLHGQIRDGFKCGKNNMVLGVNEKNNKDFIYFVKYFQRIQKSTGIKYKDFVRRKTKNSHNVMETTYVLHIYGHSLDETDEDVLGFLIGNIDKSGAFKLNPQKVVIYYYNASDYEQKVINLIKLYGRTVVEENMEKGKIRFVQTTCDIVDECEMEN